MELNIRISDNKEVKAPEIIKEELFEKETWSPKVLKEFEKNLRKRHKHLFN